MAVVLVVEPIFDVDFPPEQHAYRTGRDAHGAIRSVQGWLDRGDTEFLQIRKQLCCPDLQLKVTRT
jgi:retron-type reverse transcriptase